MKKALKKALFIDRDGTLIVEPPVDMQVDSLAKLEFVPREPFRRSKSSGDSISSW